MGLAVLRVTCYVLRVTCRGRSRNAQHATRNTQHATRNVSRLQVVPHPAADVDRRAGDVAGPPGTEEGHQGGHLLRLAEAPQRDVAAGHGPEEDVAALFGRPLLVNV